MREIFELRIEENSIILNGEKISEEEATRYFKNGLKYEGLKEQLGKMGVSLWMTTQLFLMNYQKPQSPVTHVTMTAWEYY